MSVVSTSDLSDSDKSASDSDLEISISSNSNGDELVSAEGSDSDSSDKVLDDSSADAGASDSKGESSSLEKASDDSSSDKNKADDSSSDKNKESDSSSDKNKESDSSSDKQTAGDSSADNKTSVNSSDDSSDSSDCNLTITKVGDKKVKVGETVTWNITVKNSLNDAKKVVVKEKLPKNFELVSANASTGTFNKKDSSWKIGDLKKSESATLIIKAKAQKAGNYTNKAELLTDSKNLNKNTTVKADVEVVPAEKSKVVVKKNQDKKVKKDTKVKEKVKTNQTKVNNTNQTKNKKADLKNAGNPIMVILISILTVLGLNVLKKQ